VSLSILNSKFHVCSKSLLSCEPCKALSMPKRSGGGSCFTNYFSRSSVLSFPNTCIISTRPGPSFIPVKACLIVVMNDFRGISSRFCSSFNVRRRTEGVHESAESNRDVQRMEDIAEMVRDRWSGLTLSNMDLASSVDKSGSLKRYGACFGMSQMLTSRPLGA